VLYIGIAVMWCLLAFVGLALCRLAAISDDAHALELSERVTAQDLRAIAQTAGDAPQQLPRHGERRRATG
jgi:hypothetical protein